MVSGGAPAGPERGSFPARRCAAEKGNAWVPDDGANGAGLTGTGGPPRGRSASVMPRPGETFAARYSIERLLGRGGMGVVFLARQAPLDRRVALKILQPPEHIEDDPNFDARFLREAAAAARLQHPNTITVYDFGQTETGQLYIVMEYLEGADLRSALAEQGPFGAARALHIGKQVCKSLREAHAKGLVHRDLKPANVLLVERDDDVDFVKVLDFGLVKFRGENSDITLAGRFLGSPRYTSPEALDRNAVVDHRADIYSLGILLYTMLTGAPPFDGDPMQILNAHLHDQPRPMSVANPATQATPELEALVQCCLEKDPTRRYQDMDGLLAAMREVGGAFGDEQTETLDLELGEPGEAQGQVQSMAWVAPEMAPGDGSPDLTPTRAAPSASGTSIARSAPRKKKKPPSQRPRVLGAAVGAVLAVVAVALLVRALLPRDEIQIPSSGAMVLVPATRPVRLSVAAADPGAAVSWMNGDRWEALGTSPVERTVDLPVGRDEVLIRIEAAGRQPETEIVAVVQDEAILARAARPFTAATPAAGSTPEPTAAQLAPEPPRATPPPRPDTVATPSPAPAASPRPTPEPTEEPAELPTGYKDNPY